MRVFRGMRVAGLTVPLMLLVACASDTTSPLRDAAGWQAGILQLRGYTGNILEMGGSTTPDRPVRWTAPPQAGDVVPPRVLIAPDTVTMGQVFEVKTVTIGLSGCWRAEGQSVNMNGRIIELKPYDGHSGSEICTTILTFLEHASSLSLSEQGEWTIRVMGRRVRHGDDTWFEPVTAEQTIWVR
jgi:hypothetical protein